MTVNKNIAISDSGFIFNPTTGDSFTTNDIGMFIIQLLKSGKTTVEVVDNVCEKYNTDKTTVEKDLQDYIHMLQHFQLAKS